MASAATRGRSVVPSVPRERFESEMLESEAPVLAELHAPGVDYGTFSDTVRRVLHERGEDVGHVSIDTQAYRDVLDGYRGNKGYHAFDLERLPAAALFREGRLVTTFNSTLASPEPAAQRTEIRQQFERFLNKFLHYDPEKLTFNHKK